jgi:DNA repair protein RadC
MSEISNFKKNFFEDLKSGKIRQMIEEQAPKFGDVICNSDIAYNIFSVLHSEDPNRESFYIAFLNTKNEIIKIEKMFEGSLKSSSIYPREIVKKVIKYNASAIICSHNHPSGGCEPSISDIQITKTIMFALSTIDCTFHEHIICGKNQYYSFADMGNMTTYRREFNEFISRR